MAIGMKRGGSTQPTNQQNDNRFLKGQGQQSSPEFSSSFSQPQQPGQRGQRIAQGGQTVESNQQDVDFSATVNREVDQVPTGMKKGVVVGVVVVALVIVAFLVLPKILNRDYTNTPPQQQPVEEPTVVPEETTDPEFQVGENDYYHSKENQTSARYFEANDFVKDLDGNNVPAVYTVKKTDYITDHVAYTAKRAIIDDGMEMYWIDVDYKKKKYRVQVPFYYYKDFDDTGICRVEIELLTLENGSQIISYMQVIGEDDE